MHTTVEDVFRMKKEGKVKLRKEGRRRKEGGWNQVHMALAADFGINGAMIAHNFWEGKTRK